MPVVKPMLMTGLICLFNPKTSTNINKNPVPNSAVEPYDAYNLINIKTVVALSEKVNFLFQK